MRYTCARIKTGSSVGCKVDGSYLLLFLPSTVAVVIKTPFNFGFLWLVYVRAPFPFFSLASPEAGVSFDSSVTLSADPLASLVATSSTAASFSIGADVSMAVVSVGAESSVFSLLTVSSLEIDVAAGSGSVVSSGREDILKDGTNSSSNWEWKRVVQYSAIDVRRIILVRLPPSLSYCRSGGQLMTGPD